ncbi:hypothetical protein C2S52_004036 [Perilla frutescens var. hirtella]|nr:hypothetical protein C2S52_004036 [Perilla frutescens var. hirtella]
MGLIENGAAQSKNPRDLDQDRKCDTLTQDNYQMDHERFVSETVEQKEMNEAQNIEMTSVSALEKSDVMREIGLNDGEISPNEDTEKREPALENVNIYLDSTYLEVASQNGFMGLEHMGVTPGTVSVNPPGGGKLVPVLVEATNDSGLLENNDRGSSGQRRKRKAKLKGPASSSWVLRSKMPEKPKAPESIETVKEGIANGEKKRRGRKGKNMQKSNVNEFARTKTHLRYLLHRINYEQNLIDAYSAEGWRGQSVDKLKPEKELEKAKSRILGYKLKIRALFQCLDQSLSLGKLPESLFDSQGEIDSEDIFCAKCGSKDLTLDNDIILCDGACERGFHQFCLEPPLLKKDIPPGDESWLCPGCECKADCIDILKDFQGARISIIDSWEKIFPEAAAAAASGKKMDDGPGSSSDDSEDEEYDPDKPESSVKVEEDKSSSDESNYSSASGDLAASNNNEQYLGLPSDDSEDDDFDPSAPHQDNQVKQDSSSSDFSSDSEDLEALIEDETAPSEDPWQISPSAHHKQKSLGIDEEIPKVGRKKRQSIKDELSYLMEASAEPLSGKRHVERLDYKKLNDETYGDSSDSSDEDFDDTITRKRRKTDRETTEVKSETLVSNQTEKKHIPKRTPRNQTDGHTNETSVKVGSAGASAKRSTKRLGEATTQRLYAYFGENQYPDKAVKENLATELGLTVRQVSKWFENMRWSFNHRPQVGSDSAERAPEPQSTIGADGTPFDLKTKPLESSAIPAQKHIHTVKDKEILETGTSGDSTGTRETRKRKGNLDQEPDDEQNVLQQVVNMQSSQLHSGDGQIRSSHAVS